MTVLEGNEYNKLLPSRSDMSHKGGFGTVAIVGGCRNYQGAPYFATQSALRTGVGIAVAFIPDEIVTAFCSKISGAVVEPLKSADGFCCDDTLAKRLAKRRVTAAVVGCGLGISDNTENTVFDVLSLNIPVVIDGDGLSAVAKNHSLLLREAKTILTPHMGELSRLLNVPIDKINEERCKYVADLSVKYNCITVSKDSDTLISNEKGELFLLSKPCSALSKGGSGDVLAGMIGSFLAQGMSACDSAVAAVTLHNACGRAAACQFGAAYSQPDDYIYMLPKVIK